MTNQHSYTSDARLYNVCDINHWTLELNNSILQDATIETIVKFAPYENSGLWWHWLHNICICARSSYKTPFHDVDDELNFAHLVTPFQ